MAVIINVHGGFRHFVGVSSMALPTMITMLRNTSLTGEYTFERKPCNSFFYSIYIFFISGAGTDG